MIGSLIKIRIILSVISIITIFTLVFSSISINDARAQGAAAPASASGAVAANSVPGTPTADVGTRANTLLKFLGDVAEVIGKALVRAAVKRVLDKLSEQTINWIKGNGTPQFIDNFGNFLSESADEAVGETAMALTGANLCAPFKPFLKLALSNPKFSTAVSCTASGIIKNVNKIGQSISNGDWTDWFSINEVQNTPHGAFLSLIAQRDAQEARALQTRTTQAQAGGGFKGQTACTDVEKRYTCYDPSGREQFKYTESELTAEGFTMTNVNDQCPSDQGFTIKTDRVCKSGKDEIITPGSYVSTALNEWGITKDVNWLISAKEMQDYVVGIADAFVERVAKDSLSELGKAIGKRQPAGVLYSDTTPREGNYNPNLSRTTGLSLSGLSTAFDNAITAYQKALPYYADFMHIKLLSYFAYQNIPSYAVSPSISAMHPRKDASGSIQKDSYGNIIYDPDHPYAKKLQEAMKFFYDRYFKGRLNKIWTDLTDINGRIIAANDNINKLTDARNSLKNDPKHFELRFDVPINKIYFTVKQQGSTAAPKISQSSEYGSISLTKKDDFGYIELSAAISSIKNFERSCKDFIDLYGENKFDDDKLDPTQMYIESTDSDGTVTDTLKYDDQKDIIDSQLTSVSIKDLSKLSDGISSNYCSKFPRTIKVKDLYATSTVSILIGAQSVGTEVYSANVRKLYLVFRLNQQFKSLIAKYLQKIQDDSIDALSEVPQQTNLDDEKTKDITEFTGDSGTVGAIQFMSAPNFPFSMPAPGGGSTIIFIGGSKSQHFILSTQLSCLSDCSGTKFGTLYMTNGGNFDPAGDLAFTLDPAVGWHEPASNILDSLYVQWPNYEFLPSIFNQTDDKGNLTTLAQFAQSTSYMHNDKGANLTTYDSSAWTATNKAIADFANQGLDWPTDWNQPLVEQISPSPNFANSGNYMSFVSPLINLLSGDTLADNIFRGFLNLNQQGFKTEWNYWTSLQHSGKPLYTK